MGMCPGCRYPASRLSSEWVSNEEMPGDKVSSEWVSNG